MNVSESRPVSDLFHHAPQSLEVGSIILPGNYGRLLHRYGVRDAMNSPNVFGNAWVLVRELLFEEARKDTFADRPSRLNAVFMHPSLEAATDYQVANDFPGKQVLHLVEIVDPTLPCHVGAISLANLDVGLGPFLEQSRQRALQYWRGEGDGHREVLSASPVRVVGRVA